MRATHHAPSGRRAGNSNFSRPNTTRRLPQDTRVCYLEEQETEDERDADHNEDSQRPIRGDYTSSDDDTFSQLSYGDWRDLIQTQPEPKYTDVWRMLVK